MTPPVAATLLGLGVIGLFHLERDRDSRTSPALWLPVAWTCLGASRMVTEWLGGVTRVSSPDEYLAGSPLDRAILSALLGIAMMVLLVRGGRCTAILRLNAPLLLFLLYCAASVLWSDFPWVALKRWTKAVGNVVMVLVVLTDANPSAAIRRFFAWTGFLLIPVSVLLIAYFPGSGLEVHRVSGMVYYIGAATQKNGLGAICLIVGLATLWRLLEAVRDQGAGERIGPFAAHGLILALALWLLRMSDSSTSLVCFLLGSVLLVVTTFSGGRRFAAIHASVGALVGIALCTLLFSDVYASFVGTLGRSVNLTGRRGMWATLFTMNPNPWFGTGFESFWLGDRARAVWRRYSFHPNQAHNGYLETYLTLGWIGVGLLVTLFASGYRHVITGLQRNVPAGRLKLAFLVVAVFYNVTEAGFKVMHLVWIAFLFAIMAVPDPEVIDSPGIPSRDLGASRTPASVRPSPRVS